MRTVVTLLLLPLAAACGTSSSSGISTGQPVPDAAGSDAPSIPDNVVSDTPMDAALDTASDAASDTSSVPDAELPGVLAQRVLVVAANDTTIHAELFAFEDTKVAGSHWNHVFSHPVTIGRNGLAWGKGLHDPAEIPTGETIKVEGDGKSPMGKFALTQAWGYLAPENVDTQLPYETATPKLLCIDDVNSPLYNSVVDFEEAGLPADNLPSHEDMLRSDDLYKYTIFVAHNSPSPVPGAGSCIFLHLWSHASGSTAGCTAMAESDMVRLIEWLDPSKSPVLVQVTKANYDRFKSAWNLPELP